LLHLQLPVERAQTSGKPGEGTAGKLSKAPMVGIGSIVFGIAIADNFGISFFNL
jgi:hypothetical protein